MYYYVFTRYPELTELLAIGLGLERYKAQSNLIFNYFWVIIYQFFNTLPEPEAGNTNVYIGDKYIFETFFKHRFLAIIGLTMGSLLTMKNGVKEQLPLWKFVLTKRIP